MSCVYAILYADGMYRYYMFPCRLGLGAVPPQDLAKHVYQKQLEKRVKRKVVGKRRIHPDSEGGIRMYIHTRVTTLV